MSTENPQQFPQDSETFYIHGEAGRIEMLTAPPNDDVDDRRTVALICHPHPLYGGTMRNKVVHMIERAFRDMGVHAVRFNFRGVGESEGSFDNGIGETRDLVTVHQWAQSVLPGHACWLAGFSFGSYVALRGAAEIKPEQFLTVAPPVERFDFSELDAPDCPWLVIQGEEDDVVSARAVRDYVDSLPNPPQLVSMKAGHFFHRRLLDLKGAIKNGILRQLDASEPA